MIVNGANPISRAIGAPLRGAPRRPGSATCWPSTCPLVDPTLTTQQHQSIYRAAASRAQLRDPIAAHLRRPRPRGPHPHPGHHQGAAAAHRRGAGAATCPIRSAPGRRWTRSSRCWARAATAARGLGSVVNPYFASDLPFDAWRAQHPDAPLRYLVARLTGYQTELDPETGVPRDVAPR